MNTQSTRSEWIGYMRKIVDPVIENLERGTLKANMPKRFYTKEDRSTVAPLEAFGRMLCGLAPFLDTFERSDEEEALAESYRKRILVCLDKATDPKSPDYMPFGLTAAMQPLVDAAFMAHGIIRSGSFVERIPAPLKSQIIDALSLTRAIIPCDNNWILFSGMVEAAIHRLGGKADVVRIAYNIRQMEAWYKGDGFWGDGAEFAMNYYNSFVIIPMLVDIVNTFAPTVHEVRAHRERIMKRAMRAAEIQERMINRDGTYPYLGRSITYRFGAFQLLAQAMLQHFSDLSPASVRCGLTAVIRRIMESPIFDEDGWLLHGIYGEQPSLSERYISTGSLYLCTAVFLPLGLPESDPFWSDPDEKWTSLRITDGEDVAADFSK